MVFHGFLLGGHVDVDAMSAASGLQAARILSGTRAQDLPVYVCFVGW